MKRKKKGVKGTASAGSREPTKTFFFFFITRTSRATLLLKNYFS